MLAGSQEITLHTSTNDYLLMLLPFDFDHVFFQVKFFVRKRDLTRNSPLSDINRNLSRFITYKTQTLAGAAQ